MHYLLLNPFNPTYYNGICSYFNNAELLLRGLYQLDKFENTFGDDLVNFRQRALDYVSSNYNRSNVIIEAPETRAATLLFDRGWKVHVRLHTPMAICEKYDGIPIDQQRLSDEIRVISQAQAVTSPSKGINHELSYYIDTSRFVINKNPILLERLNLTSSRKDIDVIYMGRIQRLKGAEHLTHIFSSLPQGTRVAIIGSGASDFEVPDNVDLQIKSDHINDNSRFEILSKAKVSIVPSIFENCSMAILEAIATRVPVVAWRVGGNSEFDESVVTTVQYGDVKAFCGAIQRCLAAPQTATAFETAVRQINESYVASIKLIVSQLSGGTSSNSDLGGHPREVPGQGASEVSKRLIQPAHFLRKAFANLKR